jgi:hypothetical protein
MNICRLKELLHYSPETGIFTWIAKSSKYQPIRIGEEAGGVDKGYRYIRIDSKLHSTHRLAWLYMTGNWPIGEIHHANHITDDNRWCNLQDVSHADNMKDKLTYKNNTSGKKCVNWHKPNRKWIAHIGVNGKWIHLGLFNTREEACAAYRETAIKYFGKFANFN